MKFSAILLLTMNIWAASCCCSGESCETDEASLYSDAAPSTVAERSCHGESRDHHQMESEAQGQKSPMARAICECGNHRVSQRVGYSLTKVENTSFSAPVLWTVLFWKATRFDPLDAAPQTTFPEAFPVSDRLAPRLSALNRLLI